MFRSFRCAAAVVALLVPASLAAATPATRPTAVRNVAGAPYRHPGAVGLGAVVSNRLGGATYFFALDQNGTDAMLDDALTLANGGLRSAIEVFNSTTGKLGKTIKTLESRTAGHELVVAGIFTNDVGLIDEQRVRVSDEHFRRDDLFFTADPLSNLMVNGIWTPPDPVDLVLSQIATNQTTTTQVALADKLDFHGSDLPKVYLFVTNFATNTILHRFLLKDGGGPLAQDTVTNEAVIGAGVEGIMGPAIGLVNLDTGKAFYFAGLNNGPFGAGETNGIAVDSNTGIAATVTSLNAQIEFYDLANGSGMASQLPDTNGGSELNAGADVANDPINRLFVVAQPYSSTSSNGSSIDVFDENGTFVENIDGLNFPNDSAPIGYPTLRLVPQLRMGYVNGPGPNQIEQFFY